MNQGPCFGLIYKPRADNLIFIYLFWRKIVFFKIILKNKVNSRIMYKYLCLNIKKKLKFIQYHFLQQVISPEIIIKVIM